MFNSSIVNLSKAGNYHFYQYQNEPGTSNTFFGAAQLMKNYINYRISTANLGFGATGLGASNTSFIGMSYADWVTDMKAGTPRNLTASYDFDVDGGLGGDQRAPRGQHLSGPI